MAPGVESSERPRLSRPRRLPLVKAALSPTAAATEAASAHATTNEEERNRTNGANATPQAARRPKNAAQATPA